MRIGDDEEDTGKHALVPAEQLSNLEPGPLPPLAPDGGFVPAPATPPPKSLPSIPAHHVCLRGPCRYYMEFDSGADVESVSDVPDYVPIQRNRLCTAVAGIEIDLGEVAILRCSRWEPESPSHDLDALRARYLAAHPECVASDARRDAARAEFYAALATAADARAATEARNTGLADDDDLAAYTTNDGA
jgi:hypothetical protein